MQILERLVTDSDSGDFQASSKPLFSSRGKMIIVSFAVVMCLFAFFGGPSAKHAHNYQVMTLHQDNGRECSEYAAVVGASWGTNDVTRLVADQYNKGTRNFRASVATYGDEFGDGSETLTIVSKRCGNVAVAVVGANEYITLP